MKEVGGEEGEKWVSLNLLKSVGEVGGDEGGKKEKGGCP